MMLLCCRSRAGGLDWLCGTLLCSLSDLIIAFPVLRCQLGAAPMFFRGPLPRQRKNIPSLFDITRDMRKPRLVGQICARGQKRAENFRPRERKSGGCYRMPLILGVALSDCPCIYTFYQNCIRPKGD